MSSSEPLLSNFPNININYDYYESIDGDEDNNYIKLKSSITKKSNKKIIFKFDYLKKGKKVKRIII